MKNKIGLFFLILYIISITGCVHTNGTNSTNYIPTETTLAVETPAPTQATTTMPETEPTTTVPETVPPTEPPTTIPETEPPTTISPTQAPTEPPTQATPKGNYLVKVNVAHNCITVYEKDENGEYNVPVVAFVCSTAREGKTTPLGTFTTSAKWDWAIMGDGTYTQYVYRFNGPYLFHSVPYFTQSHSDLEYEEYNKLGESASAGCVRMRAIDAKWIYDNVGVGSTVIVYSDETSPGPLGKPEVEKIPTDSPFRGWDPTDPHPDNPWNK